MGRGAALTALLLPAFAAAAQDAPRPDLEAAAERIVADTNTLRRAEGMPALARDERLTRAAAAFAAYMARTGEYGHEADGRKPSERAQAADYDACFVAENISYQFSTSGYTTAELATRFFEGWKASRGHRRNLVSADPTQLGVAVARSGRTGYYYAVQLFGRPRAASIDIQLRNDSGAAVRYRIGERRFALPGGMTRNHQECGPAELAFEHPGTLAKFTPRFAIRAGDRFVVAQERNRIFVRRQ